MPPGRHFIPLSYRARQEEWTDATSQPEVYVLPCLTTTEPYLRKSLLHLGIIKRVLRTTQRVAVFPLVSARTADERDKNIDLRGGLEKGDRQRREDSPEMRRAFTGIYGIKSGVTTQRTDQLHDLGFRSRQTMPPR